MKKSQVPSRVLRSHFENNCSAGSLYLYFCLSLNLLTLNISALSVFFFIHVILVFISFSFPYLFFLYLIIYFFFFWPVPPFFTLPTERTLLCFLQVIHESAVFLKKELCWRILVRYIIFLIYSCIIDLCKWWYVVIHTKKMPRTLIS